MVVTFLEVPKTSLVTRKNEKRRVGQVACGGVLRWAGSILLVIKYLPTEQCSEEAQVQLMATMG